VAYYKFRESSATSSDETVETLTRRVYLTLREEILAGQLKPGDRLVRKTLAQRLGVSPMPITEVLYMLELDGLVENRALYGCRVRPLTLEDLKHDEVMREAIECQAARLCALHASNDELLRLQANARQLDRMMSPGDPQSKMGAQLHLDFHLDIARASGYRGMASELERLWFRRYMRLNWIKGSHCTPIPPDAHQSLITAISTRDADLAERAMREHVQYGNDDDQRSLQYYYEQVIQAM
jgi:DNA-binding GntR family transcriptional regulator